MYLTFADKSQYSNAAPFTVYDGPTPNGVQAIDESIRVTRGQGGRAQGSYGGVGWLQLGSYSISSGTLEVVLGNRASNSFVDADGLLIVQEGDTPSLATMNISLASRPVRSSRLALATEELKVGALTGSTPNSPDRTAARQVKLGGSASEPISVIYSGSGQPAIGQASPSATDAIMSLGIESDISTPSNLLISFARALLTENRRKPRST